MPLLLHVQNPELALQQPLLHLLAGPRARGQPVVLRGLRGEPHAEPGAVEAEQFGDSLVVQIANQRRNVTLPAFLSYYHFAGADVEGGWLRARFVPET